VTGQVLELTVLKIGILLLIRLTERYTRSALREPTKRLLAANQRKKEIADGRKLRATHVAAAPFASIDANSSSLPFRFVRSLRASRPR
jgi:hypothetical protein